MSQKNITIELVVTKLSRKTNSRNGEYDKMLK